MLILITGGARSGKSNFAVKMAQDRSKKVAFIATSRPGDKEMARRIISHQRNRPAHWKTFEQEKDILTLLKKIEKSFDVIIIDCVTLLVSNYLLDGEREKTIVKMIKALAKEAKAVRSCIMMVTNEVGAGIIPENELARKFRDIAGTVNQAIAGHASEVYLLNCGIPMKIKG